MRPGECEFGKKNVDCPHDFAQGGPYIEAQHANVAMGVYMQAGSLERW